MPLAAFREFGPGLLLLIGVGGLGQLVGATTPLHSLLAAIVVGILLTNVVDVPEVCKAGVGTHKLWLEVGIVLMGVRIALDTVLSASGALLLAVFGIVTFSLIVTETLARRYFGLQRRLGSLLAAGAGICGVSAVIAIAGSIRADEDQIAYATSTILVFDAITLFAYPFIGQLIGLSSQAFGVWAGISMFSTGPVTAAGFAYSDIAGQWATVTKLIRNVLIGGLVIVYSVIYTDIESVAANPRANVRRLWNTFPKFVLGFVSMMVVASSGVLNTTEISQLSRLYHWMFLVAFAGLGLTIDAANLRRTGLRPIALVFVTLFLVSVASLVVVCIAF